MWNSLLVLLDQYQGLIIGFSVLALVLLANLLIYRRNWTSYPTREAYLAAHPGCDTADGIVCAKCRQKAASMAVRTCSKVMTDETSRELKRKRHNGAA